MDVLLRASRVHRAHHGQAGLPAGGWGPSVRRGCIRGSKGPRGWA